ncbi:MAG: type IV pilus assembly protein PilM [Phycisphaeraceae bacterium]|nr:type IV pilus assembly protein PilM [Phycisphaeraceae bacterium]
MARNKECWGVEVGASAIKAVRLVRSGDQITLAEYEILPFKSVLTAPDNEADSEIQVNLDRFVHRHDLSRTPVVVSVPGNAAFARFAKLPPVEPKQVPAIVEFEAVQQIPFPIEQVEWDYQVFQQEDSPDVEVGIFAITKERVAEILGNYRSVGLRVDGMTLSPLAVYNALVYDRQLGEDTKGLIMLDIGSTSTDLIIVEGGGIWLRTMPIGGNNFTEVLMRAFKTSYQKAEKLKREAGTSKYARQIFQAMRPVFEDLVQEIQRSLGYYQGINRDAELTHVVGMGSTFRLPGIQKFLKQKLQMEVSRIDGFERIAAPERQEADFADSAVNLVTAYGLALQGLDEARVDANILPATIVRQRLWKTKQPIILAAASVMLLVSGLVAFQHFFAKQAAYLSGFGPDSENYQEVRRTIDAARIQRDAVTSIQNEDPRPLIDTYRSLLHYRDVWPKLVADLQAALAGVNPPEATMGNDPEQWLAVPRDQNNRIMITSVNTRYLPPPAVAQTTTPRTGTGQWDEDAPFDAAGVAGGRTGDAAAIPDVPNGAGIYQIEVSGVHFRSERGEDLVQDFLRMLRQQPRGTEPVLRDGFPYAVFQPTTATERRRDFAIDRRQVQTWEEVVQLVYPGQDEARRPAEPLRPTRPTRPVRGGFEEFGWDDEPGALDRPREAAIGDIEDLFPVRQPVIQIEPDQPINLMRFTVRWWVRIIDQEQARGTRAENVD